MRFGFLTLGDLTPHPLTGVLASPQQRLGEILDAAVLSETLGLDSFTVGEHHSARWAITSPPVVLGAMAMRTERIRLRTGVTLMPNLDPVRWRKTTRNGRRAFGWATRTRRSGRATSPSHGRCSATTSTFSANG